MRDIPYDIYIRGLIRSHTGRRLAVMLPVPIDAVTVINASPKIGKQSHDAFPADLSYIQHFLNLIRPEVVLAFGKVASDGLTKLGQAHYSIPHPARRDLSKADLYSIRVELEAILYEHKICIS